MSNLETARQLAEALESRDLAGIQALLPDSLVAKGPSFELNKAQILGFLQIMFTAFPDHRFGLTDFREEGEVIYCNAHERGTHTGILDLTPLGMSVSLPPTGKSFALPEYLVTMRVADNRVAYFEEEDVPGSGMAGILAQLGAVPSA
jgi:hypothetical protein